MAFWHLKNCIRNAAGRIAGKSGQKVVQLNLPSLLLISTNVGLTSYQLQQNIRSKCLCFLDMGLSAKLAIFF